MPQILFLQKVHYLRGSVFGILKHHGSYSLNSLGHGKYGRRWPPCLVLRLWCSHSRWAYLPSPSGLTFDMQTHRHEKERGCEIAYMLLAAWEIWKEWNRWVFQHEEPSVELQHSLHGYEMRRSSGTWNERRSLPTRAVFFAFVFCLFFFAFATRVSSRLGYRSFCNITCI
jgi:hypothetical protein